ncbi:outer membrane beta-barrel protein [Bacteroidota bacterium]
MNKALLMCGMMLAFTATSSAQLIYEITPSAGWRLGGGFNYDVNLTDTRVKLNFQSKPSFGIKAAVGLNAGFFVEFEWDRQNTLMNREGFISGDPAATLDVTIDYYHGAFVFQYAYDRLQPFGFFSLGATTLYPDKTAYDFSNRTRFSMGAGGGIKYFINHMLGLRFQGRFYTTSMNSSPGGTWCDFYGCWSTTSINWLTQWSFTGGVFVRFGGDSRRRRY